MGSIWELFIGIDFSNFFSVKSSSWIFIKKHEKVVFFLLLIIYRRHRVPPFDLNSTNNRENNQYRLFIANTESVNNLRMYSYCAWRIKLHREKNAHSVLLDKWLISPRLFGYKSSISNDNSLLIPLEYEKKAPTNKTNDSPRQYPSFPNINNNAVASPCVWLKNNWNPAREREKLHSASETTLLMPRTPEPLSLPRRKKGPRFIGLGDICLTAH